VDKEALDISYMTRVGGQLVWSPILRRNLKEREVDQLISLLNLLKGVHIRDRGEDARMWSASKDGLFLVSSFFSALSIKLRERSDVCSLWKLKAPPRVVIFRWLALRKRILTMDNLRRRGRIVVNGCQMCLREEEFVDHLMLHCKTAQAIWRSVVGWFEGIS